MPRKGTNKSNQAAGKAPVEPGFVVSADMLIFAFLGRTEPYVEFQPGAATLELQSVVHPMLRQTVVELAKSAFGSSEPVRRRGVRFHRDGEFRTVDITVFRTSHPKCGDNCIEIRFAEVAVSRLDSATAVGSSGSPPPVEAKPLDKSLNEEIAALRRELRVAAEADDQARRLFATRLRAIEEEGRRSIDELEQAYAELRANHEELQIAVTEKEEAEMQAREQRDFVEAILNAAEALVVVVDRKGRIVRFNRACQRATGRSLQQVLGKSVWGLIPADQRAAVKSSFEDLKSGRFPTHYENDWLGADGTRVRIAWSNTALRNPAGSIMYGIGVGIDVTEQRKAQAALQDSEARTQALIESAPMGVVSIDRTSKIIMVNKELERIFGYEREQLLGESLDILLPERFAQVHRQRQESYFQQPSNRPMAADRELLGRAKDGREFPIEVGLGYFEAADDSYAVGFISDVTHKVHTQQTIERNRDEIRDLAARLMTAQEDERRRLARELHDGLVQELAALKLDLAVLARNPSAADAGLIEDLVRVEAKAGRVAESARAISHQLHPAALEQLGLVPALRAHATEVQRSTGILVSVEASPSELPLSREVATGLYRIAQEALWNAVAHSGAEALVVRIRGEGKDLTLEVIDHGRGFDFDEISSRRSLGIVSMQERARLIRAQLDVVSSPGQGTIVRVHLKSEESR